MAACLNFFRSTYSYRMNTWAMCYRKNLGYNKNMHMEFFHKRLYYYLESVRNKRLDSIIKSLFDLNEFAIMVLKNVVLGMI